MDFFKMKRFKKALVLNGEENAEVREVPLEEPKIENPNDVPNVTSSEASDVMEEDDDDDFITSEVKRRLKELRRSRFMVLIPEEEESDQEEETSSSEWRDSEVGNTYSWNSFGALYDKYCERMLFFDKIIARYLHEASSQNHLDQPVSRLKSKKLASAIRSFSFKRREEVLEDGEKLLQPPDNPYHDLESAYVGQICLTWEALHCQYTQLAQIMLTESESRMCYSHVAQQFQQFLVLLERFIENEPFEEGTRVEIYARIRSSLPKLLQVPNVQAHTGSIYNQYQVEGFESILGANKLNEIIQHSILAFHLFLKMDKKKSVGGILGVLGGHNLVDDSLQLLQSSLFKKEMKLKEICKKRKGWKKKSWPVTVEDVDLLFSFIDMKVIARVLRMSNLSKDQFTWCEEKMNKVILSENKLQRDGSPVLYPC